MNEKGYQRKYLIFLTSGYPFGDGETFIENELPFLARAFEKVFILIPKGVIKNTLRDVPDNVFVTSIKAGHQWKLRLKSLFCPDFWKGLGLDFKRKNLQVGLIDVFRNGWHYFTQALIVKKFIKDLLKKKNQKNEETILYSYWLDEKALGAALVKAKWPEIKTFSRAHGWDVFEERHQPSYLPFRPWLFKALDKVFVVSLKGKEYLNLKFRPEDGKILVSYLGTKKLNENLRRENQKFSIVSCSNLISLKRVDLIIESLAMLDFPVIWTHIGEGALRQELELKAAISFKGRNTEYKFAGQVPNKQVREFYETNTVDLFISESESEGLPVSMMEAQSAGIPILATEVGGVNEIVVDGVTGWLLPPNPEPAIVAEKIGKIYKMKDAEKKKIRQNAFDHWQNNFNAEKNYSGFVNLLKNL